MSLLATRFAAWSLMCVVAQSASVSDLMAQETGPIDARWEVFANSELDDYLRLMQLAGRSTWYPWSIRSLSRKQVEELAPENDLDPWSRRFRFEARDDEKLGWTVIRPTSSIVFNSSFPYGTNDGVAWAGKGLTSALQAGVAAWWGPVSLTLSPIVFQSQNDAFELKDTGLSGPLKYADPRYPQQIDKPQRFGRGGYGRVDLGESTLRLEASGITLGASTATQQWGPALQFPLMMGANAPGFSHVFLGSANPFSIGIGRLHARAIWGRLEESDYTERSGVAKSRFGTGLVVSFSPRGTTGLELGASRFFHVQWREGGPNADDLLRIFEPTRSQENTSEIYGDLPENQLISIFGRWTLQASSLEVYFEYIRDDFADNFADLLGEPEHDAGYVLGLQKAWEPDVGRVMRFTAEVLNARKGQIRELRPQIDLYTHSGVNQGHTNRGQILGSPAAYGGSGLMLAIDSYGSWGRWRASLLRESRDEGLAVCTTTACGTPRTDGPTQDVMYSLGGEALWFKGRWEWTGGLTVTWNLNRNFESDRWNLRPALRGRVSL
ncbi:MAG: hypothetical protein O3B84_00190 [Chloroflexi bacterium]|nr:hypothetical protein [Chloroflexota bacterium]